MLSVLLCLRYTCTGCGDPMDATLHCESRSGTENDGANIKMPCPTCGVKNDIVFTPDGTVHAVWRSRDYERIPQPSVN